jgi:serine/threonine protein kinase
VPGASPQLEPERMTGRKVGGYKLGSLLGQGATGDVYTARSRKRSVAVKLLNPIAARDKEVVARFRREAETAQRLVHPNIVKVLDVGEAGGRPYLVMELVGGGSLRDLLKTGRPETLLAVMTETALALAYAHEQGVVHRDIKPENVLVTKSRHARVTDFGLARAADQPSMTTDGRLLGTAHYMSPEQARGTKASGYSDVYALGIILYEMVTGKRPFASEETLGLLYQHAEVTPEPPTVRMPYPAALGKLALECLAKNPQERPTMSAVAERLGATRLGRRSARWLRFAVAAAVAMAVATVVAPSILNPFCHDWFGGHAFRAARRGATAVHDVLFDTVAKKPRAPVSR